MDDTSGHDGTRLEQARRRLVDGAATEAEALVLDVLDAEPRSVPALSLLAVVAQRLNKPERAAFALEQALSYEPDSAPLWSQLGAVQAARMYWNEAERAYAQAEALCPSDPQLLYALGISQLAAQRARSAGQTRDRIIRAFPYLLQSHLLDGDVRLARGQIPEALAAYERALEVDPRCSEAWLHLVELMPQQAKGERAQRFATMALDPATSANTRANIEFAQARIAEADHQYDVAFDHFLRANRAKRSAQRERGSSHETDTAVRIEAVIGHYPRAAFANPLPPLPVPLRPIFIVGMPRSGTSLVEQMLAAHPQVSAGGELSAVPVCQAQFQRLEAAGRATRSQNLLKVRERYVEMLFENDLDAEFVTDKLPGNFLSLGFIRSMFPEAVIVHCTRDPVATCWSIFTSNLGGQTPSYTSLQDLAQDYRQYRRLMAHWREVLQPPMIEMSYEDLVRNPEVNLRRLVDGCTLPWDEACLNFQSADHVVTTASAVQVRQPLYTSSVDRWMRYESQLAPLAGSLAQL